MLYSNVFLLHAASFVACNIVTYTLKINQIFIK